MAPRVPGYARRWLVTGGTCRLQGNKTVQNTESGGGSFTVSLATLCLSGGLTLYLIVVRGQLMLIRLTVN